MTAENVKQDFACPVCKVSLVMSDRQGVEIDYCPECRGVWLDRGELDKIIERSTSEMNRISQPEPRSAAYERPRSEHNDGRNHHGRKRRKSFLHDLFD
jgi:hypothetical protein